MTSSYTFDNNTLTIKSHFNNNLDDYIKNQIIINNIFDIKFYSLNYEILNQLNFPDSHIKSLVISQDKYPNIYLNNNDKPIIKLDNLPISLESLEIAINCIEVGLDPQMFQNMPPKLKKLKLYTCENISFENLPNTLEILDIACLSNQTNLLDYLPSSLKCLNIRITQVFKSVINPPPYPILSFDSVPSGLESLKIIGQYDGELNCLPACLKILHLPPLYINEIKNIPKNLEELKIPFKYEHMDKLQHQTCSLKKIIIGFSNKSHSKNISKFDLETIPKSVEEIEFGDDFNQSLENLPPNVKKITFGFNFKPPSIILNDSIEYLEFGYDFNGIIEKYPLNLKHLKFGRNFNQNIINLPEGLISLIINEHFCSSINNLPSTLQILEFNEYAEYAKNIQYIPDSVHTIFLSKYMQKNKINIPKNLKNITYSENNIWIKEQLDNIGFEGTIIIIKTEVY